MNTKSMIVSLLFCFTITSVIIAQQKTPSKEERLRHLVEKLELTKEQEQKAGVIINSSYEKMFEMKEKMKTEEQKLKDAEDDEISKLLTETQKQKFDEMKKEREMRKPPMNNINDQNQREKPID